MVLDGEGVGDRIPLQPEAVALGQPGRQVDRRQLQYQGHCAERDHPAVGWGVAVRLESAGPPGVHRPDRSQRQKQAPQQEAAEPGVSTVAGRECAAGETDHSHPSSHRGPAGAQASHQETPGSYLYRQQAGAAPPRLRPQGHRPCGGAAQRVPQDVWREESIRGIHQRKVAGPQETIAAEDQPQSDPHRGEAAEGEEEGAAGPVHGFGIRDDHHEKASQTDCFLNAPGNKTTTTEVIRDRSSNWDPRRICQSQTVAPCKESIDACPTGGAGGRSWRLRGGIHGR